MPSATQVFVPHVIVMTVGGNDLLSIFTQGADPLQVLGTYQNNLSAILARHALGGRGAQPTIDYQPGGQVFSACARKSVTLWPPAARDA